VPITLATVRILLYSGGDATLLRVLIQTLDVPTVVLGSVLPLLPALFGSAIYLVIGDFSIAKRLFSGASRRRKIMVGAVATISLLVWALLSSWSTVRGLIIAVLVGVGGSVGFWYAWFFYRSLSGGRTARDAGRDAAKTRFGLSEPVGKVSHLILVPALTLAIALAIPFGMWLPQERVTVKNGSASLSFTGYVLKTDETWTTVLSADKHVGVWRSTDVVEREVCDQFQHESLWSLLAGPHGSEAVPCARDS